ncbi:MAG: Mth938-like domain-containing protein [Pseudomonadota bacterium]|nr:Mth938-like domain-containing protein [Pseudomonadota bacterium]
MHLVEEKPDFEFFLRGAAGHYALVNEQRLQASFILTPQQLIENWQVRQATELDATAMASLIALQPEVVILGTGDSQAFPPSEALAACLSRGIGIECMSNAAAARTFNVLAGEGRHVVAGFILQTA